MWKISGKNSSHVNNQRNKTYCRKCVLVLELIFQQTTHSPPPQFRWKIQGHEILRNLSQSSMSAITKLFYSSMVALIQEHIQCFVLPHVQLLSFLYQETMWFAQIAIIAVLLPSCSSRVRSQLPSNSIILFPVCCQYLAFPGTARTNVLCLQYKPQPSDKTQLYINTKNIVVFLQKQKLPVIAKLESDFRKHKKNLSVRVLKTQPLCISKCKDQAVIANPMKMNWCLISNTWGQKEKLRLCLKCFQMFI